MNKLSSSGRSSCSSSAYLDVDEAAQNLRKSSSGNAISQPAEILSPGLLHRLRPESADKVKARKSNSQSSLINDEQPHLTRNQPHHRPRLDLNLAPNQRYVSR